MSKTDPPHPAEGHANRAWVGPKRYNHLIFLGRIIAEPIYWTYQWRKFHREPPICVRWIMLGAWGARQNPVTIAIKAYGNNATFAHEWLHKKDQVMIEGELSQGRWMGRDGEKCEEHFIWCKHFYKIPERRPYNHGLRKGYTTVGIAELEQLRRTAKESGPPRWNMDPEVVKRLLDEKPVHEITKEEEQKLRKSRNRQRQRRAQG